MVEEAALTPAAHAAIFDRFAWGLLDGEHILGYPVPGALDDLTPGRRRYSFVWYRPVDAATTLTEMQTDATGRVHSEGIPPHLIRPEVIAALPRRPILPGLQPFASFRRCVVARRERSGCRSAHRRGSGGW
jgi:hypothetical protein